MPLPLPAAAAFLAVRDGQAHPLHESPSTLVRRPLHGVNLGLLCEEPASESALRFERAGRALGAQVVRICPNTAGLREEATVAQTARMMGRLYDALDCEGLSSAIVAEIRRHAGVPVYEGLGTASFAVAARPSQRTAADMDATALVELQSWIAHHLS